MIGSCQFHGFDQAAVEAHDLFSDSVDLYSNAYSNAVNFAGVLGCLPMTRH